MLEDRLTGLLIKENNLEFLNDEAITGSRKNEKVVKKGHHKILHDYKN
jgi:hypothetical protein